MAEFSGVNRRFRKLVQGTPTLLIHNGKIIEANLARERVSVDEPIEPCVSTAWPPCRKSRSLSSRLTVSISILKYDDVPAPPSQHHRMKFLQRHQ